MTTANAPTPEPESFSPANAKAALTSLWEGIPKTRRAAYFGEMNEILVVLDALTGDRDANKGVAR